MRKILMLLAGLIASSLVNAQSQPQIQGHEIPTGVLRLSYSHTASSGNDQIWAYSYSDIKNGRARVIVVDLVAENRAGTQVKSGREWELPYSDLVMQSINLGGAPQGAITIEATNPAGKAVVCTLFYGFSQDGKLRSALTDAGCVEN